MITVLIVDDNEQMVAATARALERHGLRCVGARDVHEALELAREQPPCVVLLDLALGNESGFDLHREMRADGEVDPAIIFVTSRRDQFFYMLPVLGPSDDWIIKPWDPTELVARVHLALRRTKHGAEASRELLPETPLSDRL